MTKDTLITVYGAEEICASCVGAPSSRETYEWLQAAIGRKYVDDKIHFQYIDIDHPPEEDSHQEFAEKIFAEGLFYPIVFVDDEMVAEGIPYLKTIYQVLNKSQVALKE